MIIKCSIKMKNKVLTLVLLGIAFCSIQAQDAEADFNSYFSYNVDYRLNKKTKLKFGQLIAFKYQPFDFQYSQMKFGIAHRVTKKTTVDFYYKPMYFKGNTLSRWYHRLSTSISKSSKLFSLPLKNTITAEWHFPKLQKYQYRFIYTLKYSFKNKILPLRATPYIKYQLYYYLGGKPLDYFDETGEVLVARQSPDDFHRYRIGGGIRFRPAKYFYVTLYYIWQEEFNTKLTTNRSINILNNSQTAIKYPFNDYQVVGLSLSYSITRKN